MQKSLFYIFLFWVLSFKTVGQSTDTLPEKPTYVIGFGGGIDYGGFGMRLNYTPLKNIGVFGAIGYNIVGAGYNAGLAYKFRPAKKISPYLTLMYGYNAVIKIKGASEYDKIYYGASTGFGIEFWNRKHSNYFNVELLYPFRSNEYERDRYAIKRNPGIKVTYEPIDITISIGYHVGLDFKNFKENIKSLPND